MFVRFESIQKPNSYNDSPITSLSFMKDDVPVESDSGQPDLQSPTTIHHHHFDSELDLNNNTRHAHHQHQHHYSRSSEDSISVIEDDSAKELSVKDGWLAVGNARGIVGVSYTTTKPFNYTKLWNPPSHEPGALRADGRSTAVPKTDPSTPKNLPARTNYNLRGHRAEILFVRWNEPYQKLATCDENGVIFIWIKYEGRWSIELINDRNTRVTDIAWSHDGRMALICYMDGFVLVGSVSGQRYWSSMLNLSDTNITCGVWSPNDQHVLFGTSNGHILVISVHGAFVTQVSVQECLEITGLSWSCGKFLTNGRNRLEPHEHRLAVSFVDGTIFVMKSYDDLDPKIISTHLSGIKMDWSSDGQVLAVGGHRVSRAESGISRLIYTNVLHLYSRRIFDQHRAPFPIPPACTEVLRFAAQPLSAITWGNADRRLYIACGQVLFVGWVFQNIPTLSFLSRLKIVECLKDENKVEAMPVPEPIKCAITELFSQTVCCYLPDYRRIRDFVFRPPASNLRLYCTLMRHEIEENCPPVRANENSIYVLYLEYMGGLVPILKGKRSSKLKTEFIIYDPEMPKEAQRRPPSLNGRDYLQGRPNSASASLFNTSDSENEESFIFPYLTPKTRRRLRCRSAQLRRYLSRSQEPEPLPAEDGMIGRRPGMATDERVDAITAGTPSPSGPVMDDLPERNKIVLVASNIWGTKFKFLGISPMMPAHLGSMTYRTSFLHLQPRQMALAIKELNHQNTTTTMSDDKFAAYDRSAKLFGSNSCLVSSDSEDEYSDYTGAQSAGKDSTCTNTPAIAPMTPFKSVRNSMLLSTVPMPDWLNESRQRQQENITLENSSAQIETVGEVQVETDRELQPICLKDARVREECQSILSRFANMNEEFLTLQINQNDFGRPTYSMELTTGAHHNRQQQSREPEYYHSPDDQSPLDPLGAAGTSDSGVLPTMVRQFKHQSFQSESPKHVCYIRHQPLKGAVPTKASSPNISPSKNIRQKILKESPRKSSVSYCSSEFSAPAKSYIEKHHATVCNSASTDNHKGSPFRTVKFKSCSSEAYSATNFLANSPPMSYSAENTVTSSSSSGQSAFVFAPTPNILNGDLFKTMDSQTSRPGAAGTNHKSLGTSQQQVSVAMQTYHIYDDTGPFSGNQMVETPTNAAQRRRLLFGASSKQSKSFESPLKTPGDPLKDSFEQEENHLNNVEQVVKLLSEKLSAAAREKEQQQLCALDSMAASTSTAMHRPCATKSIVASSIGLVRRNSLPFGLATANTTTPAKKSVLAYGAVRQRTPGSVFSSSLVSTAIAASPTVLSMSQASSLSWRSLPASPRQTPLPALPTQELPVNGATGSSSANAKRRSMGRHFFHSPNVMRKMRRKLSYLDCSSEDDNSSDEDDILAISTQSQASSAAQTPTKSQSKHRTRKTKSKHRHDDVPTQEFVLHNKAPLWNEVTQVYQLDFGGRVTQESAKNFQIEHNGRQVMQFGRIDRNAYTLDFEYPFSAVQALAVALANVTQRFK